MKGRLRIALVFFSALMLSCANSAINKDSGSDIPLEVYSEFRNKLFIAEELTKYDKLAWIATDSIQRFQSQFDAEKMKGYVVNHFRDSAVVSFGAGDDSGKYVKHCQVVFGDGEPRPVLFDSGRIGDENEAVMFFAMRNAIMDLGETERNNGRHNFYAMTYSDTVKIYLIPGFRQGEFVFGGSLLYTYVKGRRVGKVNFHFGYQYFRQKEKPIDVHLNSDMNEIPNECDLMKFLTYRDFIGSMTIRTTRYLFVLSHRPDGGTDFDIKRREDI